MTTERVERRLAAVLAADVAGYSRLMGSDEEGTLGRLKAIRHALVDPTIAVHRGRIVKTTGDGVLVEFASVVDAARAAAEVQRAMAKQNASVPQDARIEFRIGIHVGDIIIDDNDIFGDGVNIAARLEGIAQPGGICVSDDAQRQIRGKIDLAFDDMGPQQLKNITEPMRAWRLQIDTNTPSTNSEARAVGITQSLPLPDKPSIAVLPFQNMSGDPEQEYFADGMVEDIITALSRFKSLFVIARNSSFTYKGKAVDIKQVGRDLGVKYVLEGSVRKAANRVRITGQLIDASTGAHLWADKFEGQLDDIFDLQDRVTSNVVGVIAPAVEQAEMIRARRKPTDRLDAYDCYLRAITHNVRWTASDNEETLRLLYRAIEIDPDFALAHSLATNCYATRRFNLWMKDPEREIAEGIRLGRRALELDGDDARVLCVVGFSLGSLLKDHRQSVGLLDRALELNPNLALAWNYSGAARISLGQSDIAVEHLERAIRLSPRDTALHFAQSAMANALVLLGRYDEAAEWAQRVLQQRPNWMMALGALAVATAYSGHIERARDAMARILQIDPRRRVSTLAARSDYQPADLMKWQEGLRRAGMPE